MSQLMLEGLLTQMFDTNQQLLASLAAIQAVLKEKDDEVDLKIRQKREELLGGKLGQDFYRDKLAFTQVLKSALKDS